MAKSPARKSEDGLVITNDFIAVVDGSTAKTTHRYHPRMTNGRYAMQIVSRYIRRMPADTSCHQFCLGVTRAIRAKYRPGLLQRCLLPLVRKKGSGVVDPAAHPEERLTASAVVYSRLRREIWMVGDCQCLVNGELCENPKPYEQRLAEMRAAKVAELLAQGRTPREILACDEARAAVIPAMLEEMKQQNVTHAVIDGFPIPERLVPVITLDFRPWEIVLASDGYPFLCPTLEESEARLRRQKENDPLNIGEFKATKGFTEGFNSFDDRTYVKFTV